MKRAGAGPSTALAVLNLPPLSPATPSTARPAQRVAPPRAVHWVIFLTLLAGVFGLRWVAVNGYYSHPDELIPHAVVQQMRDSRSLDTNWALADLPGQFRYPQYNFSGYIMAIYAMEAVRCAGIEEAVCKATRLHAMRHASVVAMAFVWLATWVLVRMFAGPWTAMLATAAVALSVQLFQDSIYARPEAFCTALFLALLIVTLRGTQDRPVTWGVAGALAGLLVATKVSFAPMVALMPAIGLWHWMRTQPRTVDVPRAAHLLVVYATALALGLTVGAPHAWTHPDAVMHGIARLSAQYTTGHWPHSTPEFGVGERLLHGGHYLLATVGAGALLLAGVGAMALGRLRPLSLFVLLATSAFYVIYFCTSAAFFERNFSHVLPILYALAAIGAYWLVATLAPSGPALRLVAAGLAFAAVAGPGAALSAKLFDIAVPGSYIDEIIGERDRLARECNCLRSDLMSVDQDWRARLHTLKARTASEQAVLLSVAHFGDPRSERILGEIGATPGVKEVGRLASPFASVPTSSVHVYHAPSIRYFVVSAGAP